MDGGPRGERRVLFRDRIDLEVERRRANQLGRRVAERALGRDEGELAFGVGFPREITDRLDQILVSLPGLDERRAQAAFQGDIAPEHERRHAIAPGQDDYVEGLADGLGVVLGRKQQRIDLGCPAVQRRADRIMEFLARAALQERGDRVSGLIGAEHHSVAPGQQHCPGEALE